MYYFLLILIISCFLFLSLKRGKLNMNKHHAGMAAWSQKGKKFKKNIINKRRKEEEKKSIDMSGRLDWGYKVYR
ncbi:hypothetical protein I7I48_05461 [Histoplasma ohiense]|nr:hypothetical protein I7I48_05461 [Histoplasma ohiense (nom. inval.)]